MDMNTLVAIFYCEDNIVVGLHTCLEAPLDYIYQVSVDAYNYLARHNKINKDSEMLVITMTHDCPVFCSINQKVNASKYITSLTTFLSSDKKMDIVKAVHNDFKIKHYLPYSDIEIDEGIKQSAGDLIKVIKDGTFEIRQIKSLVWGKDPTVKENK